MAISIWYLKVRYMTSRSFSVSLMTDESLNMLEIGDLDFPKPSIEEKNLTALEVCGRRG